MGGFRSHVFKRKKRTDEDDVFFTAARNGIEVSGHIYCTRFQYEQGFLL